MVGLCQLHSYGGFSMMKVRPPKFPHRVINPLYHQPKMIMKPLDEVTQHFKFHAALNISSVID